MSDSPDIPSRGVSAGDATNSFTVQATESDQKLLQLLQRRLGLPQGLLHRWIRTGQVRLNGGRAKAFAIVHTGDMVRLPPFALSMAHKSTPARPQTERPPLPPLIGTSGDLWAFNKPSGLPSQPGTGHDDSLSGRLARYYAGQPFIPTPIHRLDKGTSGILLVAGSFTVLRTMTGALRERNFHKEYLTWVSGHWPYAEARRFTHWLRKEGQGGYEKVRVSEQPGDGLVAALTVLPLRRERQASLLQVLLHTGRTHQIRAQLGFLGYPVLGDTKYGRGPRHQRMLLHALRVILPDGTHFACLPDWGGPFHIDGMPSPLAG
ncbi:RluA family pseudouridine synthase [uncultured Desulfovibrio sp.]|uniref:RluA family pseudouridine synthase n=1 Tax=uncultured Desulfovibrio sp. TaxID=167968 RepID=UPI00260AAEC8|nr:RluA family pseudouridine synthase [uncultured Desulfovibrio sp.]